MKFCILSLFPEMFRSFMDESILQRAQEKGCIDIIAKNIRDFSQDKHRRVDDTIFGGGPGMLLRPEPIAAAIRDARQTLPHARTIYLSPSGTPLTQQKAETFATAGDDLILLCGRYEGIDQRIRATMIDEEISIGEYVLSGGEIAAAVLVDVISRLIPGVVGNPTSVQHESFSRQLFRSAEFPQFTRPATWENLSVPTVLRSGDQAAIEKWQWQHLPHLESPERRILRIRSEYLPRRTTRLHLCCPTESHIDYWCQWFNDPAVTRFLSISPPITRQNEVDFFESAQSNLYLLTIAICDRHTREPIGNCGLEIDPNNPQSASLGLVIGNPDYWGRGLGQEVITEVLSIGFQELHLSRIHLTVFPDNTAARHCYEKCGFREIGIARQSLIKDGTPTDQVLYEILREDVFPASTPSI
jgi:tRNA (guanine37-N1)-methyltransferase